MEGGPLGAPGPCCARSGWGFEIILDAGHDLLSALEDWVERGHAPERIVASKVVDGKVVRTRPLCAYPKTARYSGQGSTDDAASFACAKAP